MAEVSTIYFVGAGPGDPELITVKGKKLLEEADVVVYAGSLVKEKILGYCRKGVEIHNSASMDLEEITGIMVKAAREGRRVVRLHTGDTAFYSALNEQASVLEREGMAYGVVPGVSSASASAASLGRELTMPEVSQTVIVTRIAGRTPVPEAEKLSSLASHGATMCIFLSVDKIERVVEELSVGYPPDTPAAVVYRASWEDERVLTGTLGDIAARVKEAGITRQAIIMVGRSLAGDGKKSKLYDKEFKHGYRK
ncbi:MAG: precorrin-4 C(11)-methyltransferase [Thermodesulfobacteriota bacterium]